MIGTGRWRPVCAGLGLVALLAACGQDEPAGPLQVEGYVEGDYLWLGPAEGGQITELLVTAGDQVTAGQPVARLDPAGAAAARDQVAAELARAAAQLADLRRGRRPEEIAVIDAQIAEAAANLATTRREAERLQALRSGRVVAESTLDQARMAAEMAKARADALAREREVAALPARSDAIAAAEQAVDAARAALAEAEWRLRQRTVTSPEAGRVEEVFYQPGEVVLAGRPLVSVLSPERRKIRFFVAEPELPALHLAQPVRLSCDGCAPDLAGRISFIATEAEFTPPVIFSVERRAKLVFKIEARPEGAAGFLKVGQPVTVHLAEEGAP